MDNRIREALEYIRCLDINPSTTSLSAITRTRMAADKAKEALAILTAEPGPCDTDQDAEYLRRFIKDHAFPSEVAYDLIASVDRLSNASQVADKRVETLREFVSDAAEWSTAYPAATFRVPTPEELSAVCATLGVRIDCIAAMILRDYTAQWSDRAKKLIAATDNNKEHTCKYTLSDNKAPYPRVVWDCECGFQYAKMEGYETDEFGNPGEKISIPSGHCMKCYREIVATEPKP